MSTTIVSGVPGVGSSRVCQLARNRLGEGYQLLNFGDVMLEEAVSRGIVTSRDGMSDVSIREYHHLQRRAGEYIADRARENDLLVDTHFMVHTAHGFLPGLPEEVLRDVRPDSLVLMEASPGTIVERRAGSDHRDYTEAAEPMVDFHQQLHRAAAVTYSMHAGAPIRAVSNEDDPEDAAETLVTMIEGVE